MSTGFPIFQSIRMDLHSCQGEEIAGFGRESCVSLTTWLARHGVLWKVGMCPSLLWSQSQEGQGDTGTPTAPSPLPLSGLEGVSTRMNHWGPRAAPSHAPSGGAECGAKASIASTNLRVQLVPAPGSGEGELPSPSWWHPKAGGKGQSGEGLWGERGFGIALAQAAALQLLLVAVSRGSPEPFPKGPAS